MGRRVILDHIGFNVSDFGRSKAFHLRALEPLGIGIAMDGDGWAMFGKDNGAPGIRAQYHPHYYGAFVIAPDGHNVEAVCHKPEH